jgi:outer membrane receptor protein involved in Fe transport
MFTQPATYLSGENVLLPTTTFLRYKLPAYTTVDASLGVARDQWYVQAFVTNLNNSHASTFTSSTQFIQSQVPIRPRVFGMRIGYDF